MEQKNNKGEKVKVMSDKYYMSDKERRRDKFYKKQSYKKKHKKQFFKGPQQSFDEGEEFANSNDRKQSEEDKWW